MSNEIEIKLQKLKDALDAGVLTAEEYDKKVNDVINSGATTTENQEGLTEEIPKEVPTEELEDDGVVYFNANYKAQAGAGGDQNVFSYQNPKAAVGKKKKGKKKWIGIGAIVLVLILIGAIGSCGGGEETYDWPTSDIAKMIPEPDGTVTSLFDDEEYIKADVEIADKNYYDEYADQCKEMGFNLTDDAGDSECSGDKTFTAFNKDGYKLSLGYSDYDDPELSINLKSPIKSENINWPSSGIGSTLPEPDSMKGEIVDEAEDYFEVYVANTSFDDYKAYLESVMAAGYNKEYEKYDFSFDAYYKDSEDVDVYVKYYGNQIMYLYVEDYREDSDKAKSSDDEDSDGTVTADFKETMDNYEAFMDEYIEFMEKYNESNDTSAMLSDYADMMTKYSEFAEKIDAIDEDSLSDSDYDYYIEVTTRVTKKLADASLS